MKQITAQVIQLLPPAYEILEDNCPICKIYNGKIVHAVRDFTEEEVGLFFEAASDAHAFFMLECLGTN